MPKPHQGYLPTIVIASPLRPVIRGWANYYSTVVSKKAFVSIDHRLFLMLYAGPGPTWHRALQLEIHREPVGIAKADESRVSYLPCQQKRVALQSASPTTFELRVLDRVTATIGLYQSLLFLVNLARSCASTIQFVRACPIITTFRAPLGSVLPGCLNEATFSSCSQDTHDVL